MKMQCKSCGTELPNIKNEKNNEKEVRRTRWKAEVRQP